MKDRREFYFVRWKNRIKIAEMVYSDDGYREFLMIAGTDFLMSADCDDVKILHRIEPPENIKEELYNE